MKTHFNHVFFFGVFVYFDQETLCTFLLKLLLQGFSATIYYIKFYTIMQINKNDANLQEKFKEIKVNQFYVKSIFTSLLFNNTAVCYFFEVFGKFVPTCSCRQKITAQFLICISVDSNHFYRVFSDHPTKVDGLFQKNL